MKIKKGRFLWKMNTISTPTSNHQGSLLLQPNATLQLQTSNPDKENENETLIREGSASDRNVDCEQKPVLSKEGGRVHDGLQPSLKIGACHVEIGSSAMDDQRNCERGEDKEELPHPEDKDTCPPGGKDSVVLYTTSLRGIRKTFEDCNTIRFLLNSFRVVYSERDVSMHLQYREELWRILGGRVVPPRLFIRGQCIGGADEAVGIHEKGMLGSLLQGIPLSPSRNPCRGCGGMRFVLCCLCNGSRKVVPEKINNETESERCHECNENGLVKCSTCS